jgi:hypothetical protein
MDRQLKKTIVWDGINLEVWLEIEISCYKTTDLKFATRTRKKP